MKIDITENLPQFAEQMRRKKGVVRPVIRKAIIDATVLVYAESRGQLSERIYNQPIPKVKRRKRGRTATGRKRPQRTVPAWKRSKDLLRRERFKISGRGGQTVGIIDNPMKYAQARHDLNRPSPIDGKVRLAPWRTQATVKTTPRVRSLFERSLALALIVDELETG